MDRLTDALTPVRPAQAARSPWWPGLLPWLAVGAALFAFDESLSQGTMALLMVLAAALASLWLPVIVSMVVSAAAVLVFDWSFVPPRGTLSVDMRQDALLLATLLALSWITAVLMASLRRQAAAARRHAEQAEQLRRLGERLRDAADPLALAELLLQDLGALFGTPTAVLLLRGTLPERDDPDSVLLAHASGAAPDDDQRAGLWACLRSGHAFGPGTDHHEELAAWYLPLRGRAGSHGAALIRLPQRRDAPALRDHAQALCNQMGQALERVATEASAAQAREAAALQGTRNALLAAIAHDYRTPLACILSAASSLQDQDARLAPPQRARLLGSIVDETEALARLTDNSLQIARLESGEVSLQLDWESIEEIVGAVLRRSRQRRDLGTTETAEARVRARLEPGLPLLRCDALLLIQLLNNLVDNGLKYGGPAGVEILARAALKDGERWVVLAARDRGPGVPPGWRDRVFEAFQRGESPTESNRRGAGVGLAACRAIARAHRGDMRYRARGHGGASFECWLPWPETAQIEA